MLTHYNFVLLPYCWLVQYNAQTMPYACIVWGVLCAGNICWGMFFGSQNVFCISWLETQRTAVATWSTCFMLQREACALYMTTQQLSRSGGGKSWTRKQNVWTIVTYTCTLCLKNVPICHRACLRQILTDFQNSLTGTLRGQFATTWLLNIPPRIDSVATLPCEIWM